jgi:hypothetical protein
VGATVGQYAAIWAGPHACYNGWDNALQHRKVESIAKPSRSWDRGLELTRVNLDLRITSMRIRISLVSASHYGAENTSLLLAHTARRSMRADLG